MTGGSTSCSLPRGFHVRQEQFSTGGRGECFPHRISMSTTAGSIMPRKLQRMRRDSLEHGRNLAFRGGAQRRDPEQVYDQAARACTDESAEDALSARASGASGLSTPGGTGIVPVRGVGIADGSPVQVLDRRSFMSVFVDLCRMEHAALMESNAQAVISLVRKHGLARPRDPEPLGIPRVILTRLVRSGALTRVGRALYALSDRKITENTAPAEVARRYPQGIVCLLSALRFHDLTTQSPFEVWLGIPSKARIPRIDYPPRRIMRLSGHGLVVGIEEQTVYGVRVEALREA